MSASHAWDWSSATADGLLTNEECFMLLDVDVFNDDDLFKTFPTANPKAAPAKLPAPAHDDLFASLYPPSPASPASPAEPLSPRSPAEAKPSRADLANDLLHQLESQCKQENIFPNWLEEKVELPIFESIPAGVERAEAPLVPAVPLAQYAAPQPTEELLREFETVYGAVELTHLTPPQSPPGPATQLLLSYAQQAHQAPLHTPAPVPADLWALTAVPSGGGYEELVSVDEVVRSRAAELASPPASGCSSASSPASSPRSSCTDEEWAPAAASGRRGREPYARPADERRSRKKEQNKNAATRYRQKKKAEIEVLLGEESALRHRHAELGEKCSDLQREIRYLKGLMRDLFKAKGLIK